MSPVDERADTQAAALAAAMEAARSGDALGMLSGLAQARLIDGLERWLARRFPALSASEADAIVAIAVQTTHDKIREGDRIDHLVRFLQKVAERRAMDALRNRKRLYEVPTDPETLAKYPDADHETTSRDLRSHAIEHARRLLPRVGSGNIQAVMGLLIDAVEAGRDDITSEEIAEAVDLTPATVRTLKSRGLKRLRKLAELEGLHELVPDDDPIDE